MKKAILFLNGWLVLALILAGYNAQSQAINFGGTRTGLHPGDTLMVPLRLTGTAVAAANICFDYDPNVLAPQAFMYKQVYPVSSPTLTYTINPYYPTNIYYFNFTSPSALPVMTNRLLGYFCFIYTGGTSGTTTIHLRRSPDVNPICGLWTIVGNQIPIPTANYSSDFSISGTTGISSTVLYSLSTGGPLDWDYPGSWATSPSGDAQDILSPAKCFNVVVQGDEVQVNGTMPGTATCNNLTINPGGKLTVNWDLLYGYLGKLAVSGNMVIQSDATGTGSFVDLNTTTPTTVAGTTSVERYTTGNWDGTWTASTVITWHYIASPVSGGTINSFWGALLNYWNEPYGTAGSWMPMTLPVTTPLLVNKGYSAATTSNQVISFTGGTINTGDQTISGLTNTGGLASRGFNLVGNAFPSAIKWDGSVTRTHVDGAAYVYSGTGYLLPKMTTDLPAYEIPAEQGFYVHVSTGYTSGSMIMPNSNRVHGSGPYVKSSGNEQLNLKVNGNKLEDETSIRFNSEATEGFDSDYDAYKLWGTTACPQIYTIAPDVNLSINSLPEMTSQTVIPVGFKVGMNDTYTITASDLGSFPTGTDIYLEDLFLSKTQNLNTNPVYEFSAVTGSQEHRFDIHFAPVSGVPEGSTSNIKIYSSGNSVYVNVPMELHGEIIIYDLLGKEMKRQPIQNNTLNKINLNAELGYYLVKVLGDKLTVSGKVFIR